MAKISPSQSNGNKAFFAENSSAQSGKLITIQTEAERESIPDEQDSTQEGRVGLKTLAKIIAISIIPLTILAVEVTTYYYASQSFEQIEDAKAANPKRPKLLLPILLMGAGATASGALAALWASRIIYATKTKALAAQEEETRKRLTEQLQVLTNATDNIRNSRNVEDILQTTVAETRKAIAADRVIVYSLDEQSQGKIIAESVNSIYPPALDSHIDDPCFNAHYLEKYQNGRVQAIDDIYQAGLTTCHLAQLEPFAVRANLVVPILHQSKLMGLLIAHHCAASHAWQQSEIDMMVQIAKQVSLTLDNVQLLTNSVHLQQQKDLETKRIKSLTNATEKIRAAQNSEDILQTAVAETRKAIAADRVIVYSLDEQSQGKIIAESVNSIYPPALDSHIDDPCFNAHYLEKYQNGRVQAIDDIYQAGLTTCHLAQLEPFAVRANLVAPILHQGKLIGLLIAHHCAASHAWQQSEIDIMMQIGTQIGLALDNIKLLTISANLSQQKETETKRIKSLTKATEHIRASLNPEDIFKTAVNEARQAIAADRVVVYSVDEQSYGKMVAESVDYQYPQALGVQIDDPCFSTLYVEKYQNGRVQAVDDIYQANLTPCHLSQLERFAVKANLVVPIITQGRLVGLLIAHHCAVPHAWQQSEIDVIVQIATQIGFAIDNFSLLTEVSQVSQAFLEQLPAVADFAQVAIKNAQQAQIHVQQTNQTIKAGYEVANQTADDLADIQENITHTVKKIRYLGQSSQKISQLVSLVDNLAAQINLQGMNMLINASKTEDAGQSHLDSPLAHTMESLREELAEATTEIQSFIGKIETEVQDLSITMKNKTEKVIQGTNVAEETRQRLNQIDYAASNMNILLNNIINAAAKGVETSASNSQAILEKTNLVPQNVEQSKLVADSLGQLAEVCQQVEKNMVARENDRSLDKTED